MPRNPSPSSDIDDSPPDSRSATPEKKQLALSDWAQIAEILGVIVLIISLVFVGLQIQHNTTALESAAAQSVHDNFAGWYSAAQSDPVLMALSIQGMQDYASLSGTEKAQFIAMFMAFCSYQQNAFYKWKEGTLSDELWRGWEYVSMNFLSTAGGQAFWAERSYMFGDAFQNYVNTEIIGREPHPQAKPWGAYNLTE